ncbi:MAG: FAD-dependent oxidoreductase [Deltaproteobacteria bacterium]|nr:FAD-dependent oxidoreductase [Deltaproteobacteria bacterium]
MTFAERKAAARAAWKAWEESDRPVIFVGTATCGLAAGAGELLEVFPVELKKAGVKAEVVEVGCIGLCYLEPLVDVRLPGRPRVCYQGVTPGILSRIIKRHVALGQPVAESALGTIGDGEVPGIPALHEHPMLKPQVRIVLRNCGLIDPDRLDHYLARGGYEGLERALAMKPEEVIEEVKRSGLRGRGGGGFPTARKWELCRANKADQRYLICNADEGDPGAFMDRSVLEGDPHAVLEGMCIAAYAIGATEGYIYCRAEYPLALKRLGHSIAAMEDAGLLGDNILGSGFSLRLHIKEGAGAFVCGEETALIGSIEGRRGMPVSRPPFPAVKGLFGKPSNINNVETFANVPTIMREGADRFAGFGTAQSKGTKTFALTGKVNRTGLVEVPMGITLREVIYGIGGGILDGGRFKAAQTGGPSGGCIPAQFMDLPIDYEELARVGSIMGSGGLVILDDQSCMVDLARYFLTFTQNESCGKCVPCRLGTKQMLMILEDVCAGRASEKDVGVMQALGDAVKKGSLCGLGQTAPNPALTTIRYFRDEYLEHIREKRCTAGVCADLFISPCANRCPAGVDIPAYVSLVAEGRYTEALVSHLNHNPFPSVCARVCPHECEKHCRRATIDGEPVAIRAVKRFMVDQARDVTPSMLERPAFERKKIAVVGAGPAGLSAAYFLRRLGHDVDVYDAMKDPGGMMRYGIPRYRLPRDVLARDIRRIARLGVKVLTGKKMGRDFTLERLRRDYGAVFLSMGAWMDLPLSIPGENASGVWSGIELRSRMAGGLLDEMDGDVVVIGGGNTAVDVARSALRRGASSVTIAYRRTRDEMPAQAEEVNEAEEEGVRLDLLAAPVEVLTEGKRPRLVGIRLQRMRLGDFDSSGRRRPLPIDGEFFDLPCRYLVRAIGQKPVIPGTKVPLHKKGTIEVDRWTLGTSLPGVFAGGDVVLGPATVVEAIAHGRRAAEAIERFLNPDVRVQFPWHAPRSLDTKFDPEAAPSQTRRTMVKKLDARRRVSSFEEVERTLAAAAARAEARRCLRCDYGKQIVSREEV